MILSCSRLTWNKSRQHLLQYHALVYSQIRYSSMLQINTEHRAHKLKQTSKQTLVSHQIYDLENFINARHHGLVPSTIKHMRTKKNISLEKYDLEKSPRENVLTACFVYKTKREKIYKQSKLSCKYKKKNLNKRKLSSSVQRGVSEQWQSYWLRSLSLSLSLWAVFVLFALFAWCSVLSRSVMRCWDAQCSV